MRKTTQRKMIVTVAATVAALIGWMSGCSSSVQPQRPSATQPVLANAAVSKKAGAQLWAENCMRCHNAPSPDRYSDAQWEVIVQHMRLRANLTGEETRQITEFLKASN